MNKIIFSGAFLWGALTMAQANPLKTPSISGNALFLYTNSNYNNEDASTSRNGLDIQEAELSFYSEVDPYSRLNMLLTVHPNYTFNTVTQKVEQQWAVEPEELYAESSELPSLLLRIGKFKAAVGKHNQLHTHAFPFVDAPLVNDRLLGTEGLNDVGVSAAYLLPTFWFNEFTFQYLRGEGENSEFNSPASGDGVGVAHWKNLLDLSDSATVELGASYAQGDNYLHGRTAISGADLTLKWRPTEGGRYHSWILAGEWLNRRLDQPGTSAESGTGYDIWTQYQLAERWAASLRYDTVTFDKSSAVFNTAAVANDSTSKETLGFTFTPSEFSSYKLEGSQLHGPARNNGDTNERKIYFQANFTIGAHPAHSY
jgi:hypothetical protein